MESLSQTIRPGAVNFKSGIPNNNFIEEVLLCANLKLLAMQLTLEFGGGLELLCNSLKIHKVNVDPQDGEKLTMKHLLAWVRTNLIKERPEMFMKGDSVRPGVLVLINDCDWELSEQLDTVLEEDDVVVFISTLHGG
ncbi:Ubiquitin-related modifier 1-like protein 1 [Forsythia ovata]|uniref:Ubiquitin-related modifier 1 homolog n=1 Tax=Forsythia ovata TaxID=205694 RepID=A0ABD1PUH9_9LAMI